MECNACVREKEEKEIKTNKYKKYKNNIAYEYKFWNRGGKCRRCNENSRKFQPEERRKKEFNVSGKIKKELNIEYSCGINDLIDG